MFSDNGNGVDGCGNADGNFSVGRASDSTMSPHQSESHVFSFIGFAVKDFKCRCVDTAFAMFLDVRWTTSMLIFMKNKGKGKALPLQAMQAQRGLGS